MKKAHRQIVFLFFLVLLLDKIFILWDIFFPNALQHSNVSWRRLEMERLAAHGAQQFTVAYFGSSRSERFINLAGEIRLAEYLGEKERQLLNSIRYLHLTHVGGLAITYYQSLQRLEKKDLLPDLILLELAPEIFEAGHKNFTPGSEMIFSAGYDFDYYRFLLQHTSDIQIRKGALLRLLFVTFAVRPRPDLLFFTTTRNSGIPEASSYSRNYSDYLQEEMTGNIKQERVDFFLEMYGNNYKNYQVEPLQEAALWAMVDIAERHQKKILLWVPYVMPEFQEIFDKTSFRQFREKIAKVALQKNLGYTVLEGPSTRCRQYSDASHYSTRCTPDVMLRLLHASGIAQYPKR